MLPLRKFHPNPTLTDVVDKIDKEIVYKLNLIDNSQKTLSLVYSSVVIWYAKENYNVSLTLTGNSTLDIRGLTGGEYGAIKIVQDTVGSRTLFLPSNSKVSGGGSGAFSLSTAANSVDIATFYYDGVNLFWNLSTNFS